MPGPSKHSMESADDAGGDHLIGCNIEVYWAGDNQYYEGHVRQYDPVKKLHRIFYDDGEKKWHNLAHDDEVRGHLLTCR